MYKDVLEKLNKDRKIDDNFIERLERNGFTINYSKYEYWNSQPYVTVGKKVIWLVETYYINNSSGLRYRYRNDVAREIKEAIEEEQIKLTKETELIDSVLKIK